MNNARLTSLIEAAIVITQDMKAKRGPLEDPRPAALECLLRQALTLDAPDAVEPPACQACGLPHSAMDWHPADNRNHCPACGEPCR